MKRQDSSRRDFLQKSGTTLAAAVAGLHSIPAATAQAGRSGLPWEFCTFTKGLQHLSYDEVSEVIADIGLDGVESAVRPGGHVEPDRVEEDLPKMIESLQRHDLNLTVMTTAINEVSDEQHTESVLKTAAKLGVKRFRMGYHRYDLEQPIRPQLNDIRAKLKDLVALTNELKIKPIYQNHSGKNYFGGPIWDMAELFSEFRPEEIGTCFDIGHATVEGAKAWPLHYAVSKPYLDTVYVKEPGWDDNKLKFGPVGEGAVDKGFYQLLKREKFGGPISLHVEYLGHKDPSIVPAVIKAIRKDFATLKGFLSS